MSNPHDSLKTTELGQLQTNDDVPDIENVEDVIHIPAEPIQQVHQAIDEETSVDIPPEIDSPCIYKVLPYLRADTNLKVFDPMVVSLGPYHHGKDQYCQMEEFKEKELNKFVSGSIQQEPTKDKEFYHREIMKNINTLRGNYEEVDEYSDEALVDIILRDACFLISVMHEKEDKTFHIGYRLGMPTSLLVMRDVIILENQIPFWVIKCLLCFRYGKDQADQIVCEYLNYACCLTVNNKLVTLPWKDDGNQPLHLLEAQSTTLRKRDAANEVTVKTEPRSLTKIFKHMRFWKTSNGTMSSRQSFIEIGILPSRSVTYLHAKGIYFRPSSRCLQDITFTSYYLFGVLRLPILVIDPVTKVFFSNITAFEMSPRSSTEGEMISYVNFMKLLVETSKDVKLLRDRGILCCDNGTDNEVLKLFKDIDTFELNNRDFFVRVRKKINKHCHSKANTWMADLLHNYCQSPWTVITVFAATFILCLTFLQTYYTIHPVN